MKHLYLLVAVLLLYGCASDDENLTADLPDIEIGETAAGSGLEVTVNGARFTEVINEKNISWLTEEAPSGRKFLIVNLTVRNSNPTKNEQPSMILKTKVIDQNGETYEVDVNGLMVLDKAFDSTEMSPNTTRTGEVAFLVPKSATELKFVYQGTGESVVFDVK